MKINNKTVSILGLGYVGLPLFLAFSNKYYVRGYDINIDRINELRQGIDTTNEFDIKNIYLKKNILLTSDVNHLRDSDFYIITVPTPILKNKKPDLRMLINATKIVARVMKKNSIVIYESTVYPGVTEEICVPILEKISNKKYNSDFFCGYSPERINPGDNDHQIKDITKIVSGSNEKSKKIIAKLYSNIIDAGLHIADSIKIAEAAKVIENIQRDLNIALVNELSIIFNKLDIDTEKVLNAADTKWNFTKYTPGLVGGHCISIDPYYLVNKAKSVGYTPKVILSGRKINDQMGRYVANRLVEYFKNKNIKNKKICIFGITFKEDCTDIRNSQIPQIYYNLKKNGAHVDIYDPLANINAVRNEYKIDLKSINELYEQNYDAIIIAVNHTNFKKMGFKNIKKLGKKNVVIYDLKWTFKNEQIQLR